MHDIYKCSKEYALIAFFVVLLWTVQCDQLKYIYTTFVIKDRLPEQ